MWEVTKGPKGAITRGRQVHFCTLSGGRWGDGGLWGPNAGFGLIWLFGRPPSGLFFPKGGRLKDLVGFFSKNNRFPWVFLDQRVEIESQPAWVGTFTEKQEIWGSIRNFAKKFRGAESR